MDKDFLVGMIIGAVVGAGIGVLYAPKPGPEMRTQLIDTSRQAAGRISKVAASVAGIAGEVEDRLKHAM
jgi:gas vesicle protein